MRFQVRGDKILQRTNENLRLCNELWQNYDDDILQEHMYRGRCRTPYQGNMHVRIM